jgi:hypothetical protein
MRTVRTRVDSTPRGCGTPEGVPAMQKSLLGCASQISESDEEIVSLRILHGHIELSNALSPLRSSPI